MKETYTLEGKTFEERGAILALKFLLIHSNLRHTTPKTQDFAKSRVKTLKKFLYEKEQELK